MSAAHDAKNRTEPTVQSIANFLGLNMRTGNRMSNMQIEKQIRAPILQAVNIMILSHRLKANQPSSSSLLVGAGNGAPGFSCVGSLTYPFPNGLSDRSFASIGVVDDVSIGMSDSLLDHPSEFMLFRNDTEAMTDTQPTTLGYSPERVNK